MPVVCMKRTMLVLITLSLMWGCSSTSPQVTRHEAEGNLSHAQPLTCTAVAGLKNSNNPVDMFAGAADCLQQDNYQDAAGLVYAAMAYGYYDTQRVADKTAHQAISVLRLNTLGALSEEQLATFQSALQGVNEEQICTALRTLGRPDYYPRYMIQHGMGAFFGQSKEGRLNADFNADIAWQNTLSTIANCTL